MESLEKTSYLSKKGDTPLAQRLASAFQAKNAIVRRFQEFIDACPCPTFIDGRDGECLYVNAQFERLTGATCESMKGSGWQNSVHPDDVERVATAWDSFCQGEEERFDLKYRYRRASGGWVPCRVTATKIESGDYIGFVVPLNPAQNCFLCGFVNCMCRDPEACNCKPGS